MAVTQRVFDSAILQNTICHRATGMDTAHGATNNFYVLQNGDLLAAPPSSFIKTFSKLSSDNGFSWNIVNDYATGSRTDYPYGVCQNIFPNAEAYSDLGYILMYVYNSRIWIVWPGLGTGGVNLVDTFYGETQVKYSTTFTDTIFSNYVAFTDDPIQGLVYACYNQANGYLETIGIDITRDINNIIQDWVRNGTTVWSPGTLACKGKDDKVHIVGVTYNDDSLRYIPFNKKKGHNNGTYGTSTVIADGSLPSGLSSFSDMVIDVDGQKNICVVYAKRTSEYGANLSGMYAISSDQGSTFKNVYNPPPSGYDYLTDPLTTVKCIRADVLGGYSGSFLISNVFMK